MLQWVCALFLKLIGHISKFQLDLIYKFTLGENSHSSAAENVTSYVNF